ncbi:hypothetical protein ACP70R_012199 [Stipagrostis hirtigluma subsp. patula]
MIYSLTKFYVSTSLSCSHLNKPILHRATGRYRDDQFGLHDYL